MNRGGERAARTAESARWGNCTKLVVTFRLTSRVLDCKREMKILTLIYLGTRGRETFNLSLQFLFLSLYLLHSFGLSSPKCQDPKGSFWCQQLPNPNLSVHKGLARIAQSQEEFFFKWSLTNETVILLVCLSFLKNETQNGLSDKTQDTKLNLNFR